MSALADLHNFYEGPIPHGLSAAAIAADLEAARQKPRSPVRLRLKSYTPAGKIDRMAETMRLVAGLGRPVYRADLAEAGFSTAEIDRHGEDARALAARRVEASGALKPVEIPVTALLAAMRQLRVQASR